jgi:hypothetical protein
MQDTYSKQVCYTERCTAQEELKRTVALLRQVALTLVVALSHEPRLLPVLTGCFNSNANVDRNMEKTVDANLDFFVFCAHSDWTSLRSAK